MASSGIEFHQIYIEQCAAAQRIKQRFGLGNALEYLIGEKLLNFVEAAEHIPLFAQELPSFVAEIKQVFSLAEVGNYAVESNVLSDLVCPSVRRFAQSHRYRRESIRLFKAGCRNQSSPHS
jgi:hypothetical protein